MLVSKLISNLIRLVMLCKNIKHISIISHDFEAEHQANTYLLDAGVQQILIDAGAPEARLEGLNRNRLQSIV